MSGVVLCESGSAGCWSGPFEDRRVVVRGAAWRYVTERSGNKTQLGNMPLWLPPVELQREFGRRVSAVKAMTTLHGSATKLGQDAASSLAGSMLAAR